VFWFQEELIYAVNQPLKSTVGNVGSAQYREKTDNGSTREKRLSFGKKDLVCPALQAKHVLFIPLGAP